MEQRCPHGFIRSQVRCYECEPDQRREFDSHGLRKAPGAYRRIVSSHLHGQRMQPNSRRARAKYLTGG